MDTIQALKTRKSVRSYLDTNVSKEDIDKIVESGKNAPNAGPFQITVITNKDLLSDIDTDALNAMKSSGDDFLMQRASIPGYRPLYKAPVLIMLSSPSGPYAQANTSCAATCMTLAATTLGLGSCYVVSPTLALDGKNSLSKKIGISEGNIPMCGVLIGHEGESSIPNSGGVHVDVNYI